MTADAPRVRRPLLRALISVTAVTATALATVATTHADELAELPGVSPSRTHQIVPGALVADAVMDIFDLAELAPKPGWPQVHTVEMPPIGISASDIRERVQQGLPIDFMVPAPVHEYVRRQGLYA